MEHSVLCISKLNSEKFPKAECNSVPNTISSISVKREINGKQ